MMRFNEFNSFSEKWKIHIMKMNHFMESEGIKGKKKSDSTKDPNCI